MSKASKNKKERVPRMTEEQYAKYVSSLKEEEPIAAYREFTGGDRELLGTEKKQNEENR